MNYTYSTFELHLTPEKLAELIKEAERFTMSDYNEKYPEDQIHADDGGNFDDTYWSGVSEGHTDYARFILDAIGVSYEIKE